MKNESELYSCHFCCEEGDGEIKKELSTIKTELRKLEKLEKLDQLTESINFMSAKFDEVFKDVAENKKKITAIEKENKKLKSEVMTLKQSVKILHDERVKNDCIISGLKAESNDNALDAVLSLSKSVGVELEKSAVEVAYFIGNKRRENANKTLVVKFAAKTHKEKLMGSKAKLKANEDTKNIFVNDYLSKDTLSLLYHAKSLKSIGFQYVYARDGKVFCKKSEISRQILIKSEDDVDQMLLDATTNKHFNRRSMVCNRDVEDVHSGDDDDVADFESPS